MVRMALQSLGRHLEETLSLAERITVLTKPKRSVEATSPAEPGTLLLAPETLQVKCFRAADCAGKVDLGPEAELDPPMEGLRFFLQPATSAEFMAPFWFVGKTGDERQANLEEARFVVTLLAGQDYAGETTLHRGAPPQKRVRLLRKAAPSEREEMTEQFVILPVLVNKFRLEAGEELLNFQAPAAKKARAPVAITLAQLAKRQRAEETS